MSPLVMVMGIMLVTLGISYFSSFKRLIELQVENDMLNIRLKHSEKMRQGLGDYIAAMNPHSSAPSSLKSSLDLDEKTRKLLKLALNTTNPNEAMAAALQVCKRLKVK